MRSAAHDEAIELLLSSISHQNNDGLSASFLFGKPGAPMWQQNRGADISYNRKNLNRAALYVRQHGPSYLKYLSIGDIWSMLQDFVSQNYWYLANEAFLRFDGNYAQSTSTLNKSNLAQALSISEIFEPNNRLTLFPLVPIRVTSDFDSETFFLVDAKSLDAARLQSSIDIRHIVPDQFPPLRDWKGQREKPTAWLGVRSPLVQVSTKMKAAILGALALAPMPRHRYMFSGRSLFGGVCTITEQGGTTTSFREAHTPPLMYDIMINADDQAWLGILAAKLMSPERIVRRQLTALEYFYRSWELDPPERFPVLCMTLDAIFGEVGHATQAVIDGVRGVLGSHIREARIRLLMELRASVIHGGAPDVYDSRKYARYYDDYDADPIYDLELVVTECLRTKIFNSSFREQPNPNAKLIEAAQALGRFPKNSSVNTILDDGT